MQAMTRPESRTKRGLLLALLVCLACGVGAVSLWADTCSYTYHCSSAQCASLMGGASGTKSQSGVTKTQCETARNATIPGGSSECTCVADGAASASTSTSGAMISNTGNFSQDTLTNSVNLAIVMNTKNPIMSSFMQGAATSFISSLFADNSEALRQQQAMTEEILRRAREQAEQRRIAEQQRLDAQFARLNRELKLEGLPFSLLLKGMNSADPAALQLKSMSSSGPEALSLKLSQSSPTSYGLKGLPGIYVGGPAGSDDSATTGENPNLVNGPGTGRTGPGIPGLPGIYLDGAQPEQAAEVAQAATNLTGPDKIVAQDTALEAAQRNPALTQPSQDPKVQTFQETVKDYDQATQTAKTTQQEFNQAQSRADADKTAIDVARTKIDLQNATPKQQQAFNEMLGAAKTDEDAAVAARKIFENANAKLSLSRTNAATALSALAPASASTVDLRAARPSATVANLKTPARPGTPISMPVVAAAPSAPAPKAIPTQTQLQVRLQGLQDALRRLAEDEKKRGEARAEAAKDVDEAMGDAEERGLDMLVDLLTTGWDNCAPKAGGGIVGKFEDEAKKIPDQIEEVYREASAAKDVRTLGAFNEKKEQLDRTKIWLESSAAQIKRYNDRISQAHAALNAKEAIEKSNGDWESSLEELHNTIETALDDEPIKEFLKKSAGLATCHVVGLKATSSIVDSVYDIFKEGDAAVALRQMDDNTMKFLAAQKTLDGKLKATTAQLNCYKLPDAANVVRCLQAGRESDLRGLTGVVHPHGVEAPYK
jgi:hypothetical protein